jgi:hypothetical protein
MLKILSIVAIALGVLVAAYLRWVVPLARSGNVEIEKEHMGCIAHALLESRNLHGTFPKTLWEIRTEDSPWQIHDRWKNPLKYETDGTTFLLVSAGPDRLFGTSDDIIFKLANTSSDK